jgi:dTDP-4-dehydrorhamnose reductase
MQYSKQKVLITGANGQLATELKKIAEISGDFECFFSTKEELDITNKASLDKYFENKNVDIIINCAAYTRVDDAEKYPDIADKVNHLAVRDLAVIAKEADMILIHISTDYVFSGTSNLPYKESANTKPRTVYGRSKLAGEIAIFESQAKAMIIRTSWLYSIYGNNFLKTIISKANINSKLEVVSDQIGTPNNAKDLAFSLFQIIKHKNFEAVVNSCQIFHFSSLGACSWYEFAKLIVDYSKIECNIQPIESKHVSFLAKRPKYSVLSQEKIMETFDLKIPYWSTSLKKCFKSNFLNGANQ